MLIVYIMLAVGGMLLGGAYSFAKQKHPLWSVALLSLAGLLCCVISLWRIFS
ncbi:hypothetical protein ACUH94_05540 [Dermabacteraceae bacterium P7074]